MPPLIPFKDCILQGGCVNLTTCDVGLPCVLVVEQDDLPDLTVPVKQDL